MYPIVHKDMLDMTHFFFNYGQKVFPWENSHSDYEYGQVIHIERSFPILYDIYGY